MWSLSEASSSAVCAVGHWWGRDYDPPPPTHTHTHTHPTTTTIPLSPTFDENQELFLLLNLERVWTSIKCLACCLEICVSGQFLPSGFIQLHFCLSSSDVDVLRGVSLRAVNVVNRTCTTYNTYNVYMSCTCATYNT